MDDISSLKNNLPVAMSMAAFAGIAWYICFELNIRLFLLFRRRRGLYFWSCVLCSWGIILQPLTILMADFGVWTNLNVSIVLIHLSWWIMVIPQSLVLYSRLHLVMHDTKQLRWVLYMIIFNTIVFSIPTIVLGVITQISSQSDALKLGHMIWEKVQVTVFFIQETVISTLYVLQARKYLKDSSALDRDDTNHRVMKQLIRANLLIIFLDITLIAMQYANFFYLQGAYKPCVYGVKLRVELSILERLISSMQRSNSHAFCTHGNDWDPKPDDMRLETSANRSQAGGDQPRTP